MRLLRRDRPQPQVDRDPEADTTVDTTTAPPDSRSTTTDSPPRTVRERTWTFTPSQVVSFIAGVGLVALGLVAMIRAGVDGDLSEPTVRVLTYTHTAWLGLLEIGVGTLLILAGMGARGRFVSITIGAALVIAGVLIRAEPSQMPDELGIEPSFGWAGIVLGAVVALAAMALPVWRRRELLDQDVINLRDNRYDNRRVPF